MPEFLDLHGKTNKVLRSLAEDAMQRHGLHLGQDHLLAMLWERDGRSPGEIATALNVAAPTVVKMVARMASAGLLTKRPDREDNRVVRLWLTATGRRLQRPVETERRVLEERVTAALARDERAHLIGALAKVYRSASELLARAPDDSTATSRADRLRRTGGTRPGAGPRSRRVR
jgi:MarR family transcriptional regulator, organic hydroperoxide resistance regulator